MTQKRMLLNGWGGIFNSKDVEMKMISITDFIDESIVLAAAQRAARLDLSSKEVNMVVRRTRAVAMARSNGNDLATCKSKLGQFEKAIKDWTAALNVRPSYRKARLRRVNCYAKVMASKTKIYIVLEYVGEGICSCHAYHFVVAKLGRLKEDESRRYFQQLINPVDYCHSRGMYHRDLKPENLLLDSFGVLKVSDFGLSAFSQQVQVSIIFSVRLINTVRSEKSLRSIHFLFIFMPSSLTCCLSTNLTPIFSIDQVVVQKVKKSEIIEQDSILLVQCGDVELGKKTDEKIGQFIDRVEKHPSMKIDEKIGQFWIPQGDYIELHRKRNGYRHDHFKRKRKKEAHEVHKRSQIA
ncbi:hypothetical protein TEA_010764 [Camellia sinensis var. sinensis]|uniref:Protein kinase domain-containing protein n=1 Tax=Camellia sinensis var. sinensis TaxID=542762 RepID=A0A4S4CYF5_CAMSN|nr:hypothetical protein TEA_010764 [Camellia sinensis var. sinensis]